MISWQVRKYFALFMILASALGFFISSYAYGQENNQDGDHFDGSEYGASSFKDTSFEKEDFREHFNSPSLNLAKKSNDLYFNLDRNFLKKQKEDKNSALPKGNEEKGHENSTDKNSRNIIADRSPPVTDLPGDWVPDKLDLTSNGGFGIAPDNGAPVPYRLNGHVDIQRGRP